MKKAALNVFACGARAGRLDRSDREEDEILFLYRPGCRAESAVSLTMPVRTDPYDARGVATLSRGLNRLWTRA